MYSGAMMDILTNQLDSMTSRARKRTEKRIEACYEVVCIYYPHGRLATDHQGLPVCEYRTLCASTNINIPLWDNDFNRIR
jgi:hypothetical protein